MSTTAALKQIVSPVKGKVVHVTCTKGQEIQPGELCVTIDSMKLQAQLSFTVHGKIKFVNVVDEDHVDIGSVLLQLE